MKKRRVRADYEKESFTVDIKTILADFDMISKAPKELEHQQKN